MGPARLLMVYFDGLPGADQLGLFGLSRAAASLDAVPVRFSRSAQFSPPPLALLCEQGWPEFSGAVRHFRQSWRQTALLGLFESATQESSCLRESVEAGLDDFLCAPFLEMELKLRVERLLPANECGGAAEAHEFKEKHNLQSLVGDSDIFFRALRKIPFLAAAEATVLITGETGTGKELFARAIHYSSARRGGPFIPVNCGALPDHLFENELFGHTRGAYTDAHTAERGLLAEADGGTLFLDEVDTLSPQAQVKLLRFLQDRRFRPLGSAISLEADVRVIAATNASLLALVEASRFREDLYHRLNVLPLTVPALREHFSDLPALAFHFLHRYKLQYKRPALRCGPDAMQRLLSYDWPGNIRELEAVIHRAVALSDRPVIEAHDFELPSPPSEGSRPHSFQQAKNCAIQHFEEQYLRQLLTEFSGNVSRAARAAGKERRSFQRLLQRHRLSPHAFRAA